MFYAFRFYRWQAEPEVRSGSPSSASPSTHTAQAWEWLSWGVRVLEGEAPSSGHFFKGPWWAGVWAGHFPGGVALRHGEGTWRGEDWEEVEGWKVPPWSKASSVAPAPLHPQSLRHRDWRSGQAVFLLRTKTEWQLFKKFDQLLLWGSHLISRSVHLPGIGTISFCVALRIKWLVNVWQIVST